MVIGGAEMAIYLDPGKEGESLSTAELWEKDTIYCGMAFQYAKENGELSLDMEREYLKGLSAASGSPERVASDEIKDRVYAYCESGLIHSIRDAANLENLAAKPHPSLPGKLNECARQLGLTDASAKIHLGDEDRATVHGTFSDVIMSAPRHTFIHFANGTKREFDRFESVINPLMNEMDSYRKKLNIAGPGIVKSNFEAHWGSAKPVKLFTFDISFISPEDRIQQDRDDPMRRDETGKIYVHYEYSQGEKAGYRSGTAPFASSVIKFIKDDGSHGFAISTINLPSIFHDYNKDLTEDPDFIEISTKHSNKSDELILKEYAQKKAKTVFGFEIPNSYKLGNTEIRSNPHSKITVNSYANINPSNDINYFLEFVHTSNFEYLNEQVDKIDAPEKAEHDYSKYSLIGLEEIKLGTPGGRAYLSTREGMRYIVTTGRGYLSTGGGRQYLASPQGQKFMRAVQPDLYSLSHQHTVDKNLKMMKQGIGNLVSPTFWRELWNFMNPLNSCINLAVDKTTDWNVLGMAGRAAGENSRQYGLLMDCVFDSLISAAMIVIAPATKFLSPAKMMNGQLVKRPFSSRMLSALKSLARNVPDELLPQLPLLSPGFLVDSSSHIFNKARKSVADALDDLKKIPIDKRAANYAVDLQNHIDAVAEMNGAHLARTLPVLDANHIEIRIEKSDIMEIHSTRYYENNGIIHEIKTNVDGSQLLIPATKVTTTLEDGTLVDVALHAQTRKSHINGQDVLVVEVDGVYYRVQQERRNLRLKKLTENESVTCGFGGGGRHPRGINCVPLTGTVVSTPVVDMAGNTLHIRNDEVVQLESGAGNTCYVTKINGILHRMEFSVNSNKIKLMAATQDDLWRFNIKNVSVLKCESCTGLSDALKYNKNYDVSLRQFWDVKGEFGDLSFEDGLNNYNKISSIAGFSQADLMKKKETQLMRIFLLDDLTTKERGVIFGHIKKQQNTKILNDVREYSDYVADLFRKADPAAEVKAIPQLWYLTRMGEMTRGRCWAEVNLMASALTKGDGSIFLRNIENAANMKFKYFDTVGAFRKMYGEETFGPKNILLKNEYNKKYPDTFSVDEFYKKIIDDKRAVVFYQLISRDHAMMVGKKIDSFGDAEYYFYNPNNIISKNHDFSKLKNGIADYFLNEDSNLAFDGVDWPRYKLTDISVNEWDDFSVGSGVTAREFVTKSSTELDDIAKNFKKLDQMSLRQVDRLDILEASDTSRKVMYQGRLYGITFTPDGTKKTERLSKLSAERADGTHVDIKWNDNPATVTVGKQKFLVVAVNGENHGLHVETGKPKLKPLNPDRIPRV